MTFHFKATITSEDTNYEHAFHLAELELAKVDLFALCFSRAMKEFEAILQRPIFPTELTVSLEIK